MDLYLTELRASLPQCFLSEYAVPGLFVPSLSTVSVRFLTDLVHKNSKNNAVNLQFKVYKVQQQAI